VAYPNIYNVAYSYTDFAISQGGSSFPGTQIDDDLAGLQGSLESVSAFVQNVIRADGALNNGIVTYDSLSAELQTAGLAPASAWAAGVTYGLDANVFRSGKLYRAAAPHVSGSSFSLDLAAGKWVFIIDLPAGPPGPSGDGSGDMLKSDNLLGLTDPPLALERLGALALAGGTMTGALTLAGPPTAAAHAATKQYVDSTIGGSAWGPGDVRLTYRQIAQAGWIMLDDGSIGDAASGATTRANNDTLALFRVMYALPIGLTVQDSAGATVARGASADADFAAHRRMVLPRVLGRALAVAGIGAGLTARQLAAIVGAETHQLLLTESPAHSHTGGGAGYTGSMTRNSSHSHQYSRATFGLTADGGGAFWFDRYTTDYTTSTNTDHEHYYSFSFTTSEVGGGLPHNNMQPSTFMNAELKL